MQSSVREYPYKLCNEPNHLLCVGVRSHTGKLFLNLVPWQKECMTESCRAGSLLLYESSYIPTCYYRKDLLGNYFS